MSNPSSSTSSSSSSSSTSSSSSAQILDSLPDALPLLTSGVQNLSRVTLQVLEGQIIAPMAEMRALENVILIAEEKYAVHAKTAHEEIEAFNSQYEAQLEALKPHLETIDALDAVVTGLEEAAKTLDAQTKQLEAAIGDVLQ